MTIADVAAHAGVGAGTVSRVLNESPRVSEQTRARVLAAIEILGYRPNPLARGLSRGRCQTIGVIVPFFTHPSAVERLRGVVSALGDSSYDLVLFNVESAQHRAEHFAGLRGRSQADGLLVMSLIPPPGEVERLHAAGVPVVLVDTQCDRAPSVITDDLEGGRIATRHLVTLGHRLIGFIGEPQDNELGSTTSARREAGYGEVLSENGIAVDPRLVQHGAHDRDVARRLAHELLQLDPRPTAIFTASDVQATGVLEAAREHDLDVPDDLSVVGFDDIELASYLGLTTVHQPLFDSGRLGAQLLLDAVARDVPGGASVHDLPVHLVERATTASPRRVAA